MAGVDAGPAEEVNELTRDHVFFCGSLLPLEIQYNLFFIVNTETSGVWIKQE